MESTATLRFTGTSARKMRQLADLVRGKDVDVALHSLRFVTRAAARPLEKLITSAVANAREKANAADERIPPPIRTRHSAGSRSGRTWHRSRPSPSPSTSSTARFRMTCETRRNAALKCDDLPRPDTGSVEVYSPFSANLVVRAGQTRQLITATRHVGPQNRYHPSRTSIFNPQMDAWYRLGAAILHHASRETIETENPMSNTSLLTCVAVAILHWMAASPVLAAAGPYVEGRFQGRIRYRACQSDRRQVSMASAGRQHRGFPERGRN